MRRKKKVLSIFLVMAMVLCFVPTTVFAMDISVDLTVVGKANLTLQVEPTDRVEELRVIIQEETGIPVEQQILIFAGKQLEDGNTLQDCSIQKKSQLVLKIKPDKNVTLGTSGISAYDKNTGKADTIYYGVYTKDGKNYNVPWYVINFDTENNTGFMLSKYTLGNSEFRNNVRGYYAGSKLQTVMNGLYNGENTSLFTGMEQGAINATTLIGSSMYSTESDIKNAHLFPLSIDEAESLGWKSDILKAKDITTLTEKACWWWLRSSDPHCAAAYVASSGDYWYDVMSTCDAVRPAFNLNLNSVLLTSASGTSKSSATVCLIPKPLQSGQ